MIRYFITSLDTTSPMPGWLPLMLLDHVKPEMDAAPLHSANIVLMVVNGHGEFTLDHAAASEIRRSKLPIIVLDYNERTPRNAEYAQLFEILRDLPVAGWFKREMEDSTFAPANCPVWPLEFTVQRHPAHDCLESLDKFSSRPVDILMMWGYSNVDRVHLHGLLMANFDKFRYGSAPAHCLQDVEESIAIGRLCPMALLYTPHYRRLPIEKVMWLQSQARVTVSLFGNGMKCFRSVEAGYNSVMAHQAPEKVQWAYPWIDRHNCIALANKAGTDHLDLTLAIETLRYWTVVDHGALYTLYRHGIENNQHYVADTYGREYIIPKIREVCSI